MRTTCKICGDKLMSDFTDLCYGCNQKYLETGNVESCVTCYYFLVNLDTDACDSCEPQDGHSNWKEVEEK